MTTVNEAADIITGTYGKLTITYRRTMYTWTVTVYNGTLRIEELCSTYTNAHAAWTEARRIALAAHEGKAVAQIEAEKPSELALAEVERLIDSINVTIDEAQAPALAEAAQLAADVEQIMAGADPNWRRTIRAEAAESAPRRIADHTRSRVGSKPPTAAELHAIRNHSMVDGRIVVTAQPGQNWLTLRALHRRIPGQPTYRKGSRRIIDSLTYRPEQLAVYLNTVERAA